MMMPNLLSGMTCDLVRAQHDTTQHHIRSKPILCFVHTINQITQRIMARKAVGKVGIVGEL
jgi:hypothetical protein